MIKECYYGDLKKNPIFSIPTECRYLFYIKKNQNDQLRFKDTYFRHSLCFEDIMFCCFENH